jgi:hypothetical protein
MRRLRVLSHRPEHKPKQAWPATPQQVRNLIGDLSKPEQCAVWVAWLTAGRLGDAKHASLEFYDVMVAVSFTDGQKSDLDAVRKITKWIARKDDASEMWVTGLTADVEKTQKYVSKKMKPLTGHSIRRGAIQYLIAAGYSKDEVCIITGHTPPSESGDGWGKRRGLSAYLQPDEQPLRETILLSLEMSKVLRRAVWSLPLDPAAIKTTK